MLSIGRMVKAMAASLAIGALLTACGGEGAVGPTQEPTMTETPAQQPSEGSEAASGAEAEDVPDALGTTSPVIGVEDLALMVLPREELGPQYAAFGLDPDSGFESNQEVIDDDECDTADEAADVEAFGRQMGYEQAYFSEAAVSGGTGVFFVGTEVVLHESAEGARGDFRDGLEELRQEVGTTCNDVTVVSLDEFDVSGMGDEAHGITLVVEYGIPPGDRITAFLTMVGLVRGRLEGFAWIASLDDSDRTGEVLDLARKLDRRVVATLEGDGGQEADYARGGEDDLSLLANRSLRLADMPPGFYLHDSSLLRLEDALSSIADDPQSDPEFARRRLESWGFVLANEQQYVNDDSRDLFDIEVRVWLLEDQDGAENAFLDGAPGISNPDIEAQELTDFPTFGDESIAFRLSGRFADATGTEIEVEGFDVTMRLDRYLASVITIGPAGRSSRAEAERLAVTLEARIRGQ
jgi:hypothetical protein